MASDPDQGARAPGRQTGQPGEAEDENGIPAELIRRAAGDPDPIDRPAGDQSMDALDAAEAEADADEAAANRAATEE